MTTLAARHRRALRAALAAGSCTALLLVATACSGDSDPKKKAAAESTVPMTDSPATVVAPPTSGEGSAASATTPATISAVDTAWRTTASELEESEGATATFDCPAGGFVLSGQLWGTTNYTDDSRICPAAVHEGVITAANGGRVTIRFEAGRESYDGSTRNGVTSEPYGKWSSTFVFLK